MTDEHYPFQSIENERQRLMLQSRLVAPLTEKLFEKAGITSGMHVLDIGSGSGDVTLLAARLVGPTGTVIGVDRDPSQTTFATQRAIENGVSNVRFISGDFRDTKLNSPVDAIVGRLVLMYTADPLEALYRVRRNLKSDGVIALQESVIDFDGPVPIEPRDCLAAEAVKWFRAGFKYSGVQARMGMRLFSLMKEAGLKPSAGIDTLVPIQQGPEGSLFKLITSAIASQLPAILSSGIATEAEIDIDTLEERMIADAPSSGVVGYFNSGHVGVWAKNS